MDNIVFIDTEVDVKTKTILDVGGITGKGLTFHSGSISELVGFIKQKDYICGHNILNHDLPYIEKSANQKMAGVKIIDTLFLSPLLFPAIPYHALLKDDKLQTEALNNPLNDAIKAKDLFYDEKDNSQYDSPDLLVMHFSHRDIWLDYFISRQKLIANLKSGDKLMVNNDGCFDMAGNCIVKFSNDFKEQIIDYQNIGYKLTESVINYIVYWQKEESEDEIRIVLPELRFKKSDKLSS